MEFASKFENKADTEWDYPAIGISMADDIDLKAEAEMRVHI